jgi:hypothetical protein
MEYGSIDHCNVLVDTAAAYNVALATPEGVRRLESVDHGRGLTAPDYVIPAWTILTTTNATAMTR